jgi:hypothetical protein
LKRVDLFGFSDEAGAMRRPQLAARPSQRAQTSIDCTEDAENSAPRSLRYKEITKLKADGGEWEGEGAKNGKKIEFRADPKTGAISKKETDD